RDGLFLAQVSIFRQLLRNGRTTTKTPKRKDCQQETRVIDTAILVKGSILRGNNRFFHVIADIVKVHISSFLSRQRANLLIIFIVDDLGSLQGILLIRNVGRFSNQIEVRTNRHGRYPRQNQQYLTNIVVAQTTAEGILRRGYKPQDFVERSGIK